MTVTAWPGNVTEQLVAPDNRPRLNPPGLRAAAMRRPRPSTSTVMRTDLGRKAEQAYRDLKNTATQPFGHSADALALNVCLTSVRWTVQNDGRPMTDRSHRAASEAYTPTPQTLKPTELQPRRGESVAGSRHQEKFSALLRTIRLNALEIEVARRVGESYDFRISTAFEAVAGALEVIDARLEDLR